MQPSEARSDTVTLRPMRASDIDAGLRLCRASGWNQVRRDWEWFLAVAPGGAWVAEYDGQVVGTVATLRYGASFGWIGMVLVEPAVRGRGVGTRLLDHALVLLSDMRLVRLDATSAGQPLYLTRRFVAEGPIHRLQAIAPPTRAPSGDGLTPMAEADLADVAAFDEVGFETSRADTLRWMWEGAPELAWVARSGDGIAGFVLGRHGHAFEHLGPVCATDDRTAFALVTAGMGGQAGRAFVIDVTARSPSWRRSLSTLGFQEQRALTRMSRGDRDRPWKPRQQFAILGPEFG